MLKPRIALHCIDMYIVKQVAAYMEMKWNDDKHLYWYVHINVIG